MNDPAKAMLELGAAMERMVETGARGLAPADDPAVNISWLQGDLTHLAVTLRSGRVIRGRGPAKLEAIQDAAERMGRAGG